MASSSRVDSSRLSDLSLRECSSDCRHFKEVINKALKCYTETAEDTMELRDKYGITELMEVVQKIEEPLLDITKRHYDIDNIINAINEGPTLLQQYHDDNSSTNQTMNELFDSHLQDIRAQDTRDINSHPVVSEFRQIISDREGEEGEEEGSQQLAPDQELVMGQVQRSLTCPLTTRQLQNPVKNKTCGHVYSKEAVLSHVRSRPVGRAKCPVGGCPEVILEANLEEDKEMKRALRRAERQQRQ